MHRTVKLQCSAGDNHNHSSYELTIFLTPGPAFWKTRRWSADCIWECSVYRMYLHIIHLAYASGSMFFNQYKHGCFH